MISALLAGLWLLPCAWQDWHSRQVNGLLLWGGLLLSLLYRLTQWAESDWLFLVLLMGMLSLGYVRRWFYAADYLALLALTLLDYRLLVPALLGCFLWFLGAWLLTRQLPRLIPGLSAFFLGLALYLLKEVSTAVYDLYLTYPTLT